MSIKLNDTKAAILQLGAALIQEVGYNAFSYADIAKQLNIKNAAIHYHFPNKADLYDGIVDTHIQYYTMMGLEMAKASTTAKAKLETIFNRYSNLVDGDRICIIGAISSDYKTLPEKVKTKVTTLVELVLKLVEKTLQEGKKNGEFTFTEPARIKTMLFKKLSLVPAERRYLPS